MKKIKQAQWRKASLKYYYSHKKERLEYRHNYCMAHQKEEKEYRKNNREKYNLCYKKYTLTEKGKQYMIKKQNKRKRNLGFNKLIENDWGCEIDWHHVNDNDVVPIPRQLHRMCATGEKEIHREICNKLVNILYEGELKV